MPYFQKWLFNLPAPANCFANCVSHVQSHMRCLTEIPEGLGWDKEAVAWRARQETQKVFPMGGPAVPSQQKLAAQPAPAFSTMVLHAW